MGLKFFFHYNTRFLCQSKKKEKTKIKIEGTTNDGKKQKYSIKVEKKTSYWRGQKDIKKILREISKSVRQNDEVSDKLDFKPRKKKTREWLH